MATYKAIEATTRAILELLKAASPVEEFGHIPFEPLQFEKRLDEGVTLLLYRLGSSSRRNLAARKGPNGFPLRPPMPVDLHYLLTAWARSAEMQQRLLGFCLRSLADSPIIPAAFLNHFASQPVFHPDESVELIFDPISLQELFSLWEPLKPNIQVSATYVARMVTLDSTVEITSAGPVQARKFDLAQLEVEQ